MINSFIYLPTRNAKNIGIINHTERKRDKEPKFLDSGILAFTSFTNLGTNNKAIKYMIASDFINYTY